MSFKLGAWCSTHISRLCLYEQKKINKMLLIKRLDNRTYQATGVVKLFLRLRLAFQKSYSTSQYVARFIVHLVLVHSQFLWNFGFFSYIFFIKMCEDTFWWLSVIQFCLWRKRSWYHIHMNSFTQCQTPKCLQDIKKVLTANTTRSCQICISIAHL